MYLSSPKGCRRISSQSGILLRSVATASRLMTSMGPCRPNWQLLRYMPAAATLQAKSPQSHPQASGGAPGPAGCLATANASSQLLPSACRACTCSVHLFCMPFASVHWPHCARMVWFAWSGMLAMGSRMSIDRRRSGKKTESGSTFTVQSWYWYRPSRETPFQTRMKMSVLSAVYHLPPLLTSRLPGTGMVMTRFSPCRLSSTVVLLKTTNSSQSKMPTPRSSCARSRPGS
mmetsp:Transcript_88066/g.227109  ORF Transcript_88066/g.227109 Transcript_88066/m.227109 type:complete len:231 (+) Transcript_88066:315-1007(+)